MDKNLNKTFVTVLMPVYNGEKYLVEAIESVLGQSYKNFEFLIINDGSADKTAEILEEYKKTDNRIRVISHKKNKGLVFSLNEGIEKSSGKYIARMDSDDISHPRRLEKEIKYLLNNKECVLLGTQYALIDKKSRIVDTIPLLKEDREIKIGMQFKNEFCHGSVILQKKCLKENNLSYNAKNIHFEDFALWSELIRYGKVSNLDEVLYFWRDTSNNITNTHKNEMMSGSEEVKKEIKKCCNVSEDIVRSVDVSLRKIKNDYYVYKNKKYRINLPKAYLYLLFNLHIDSIKKGRFFSYFPFLLVKTIQNYIYIPEVFSWYILGIKNAFKRA